MMKSKSNRSIQKILLSTYLNLMLVILLSVSFVFTAMEYVTMRKNTTESLQQICDTISQDVENQLELMNITSVNVLYSTQLKDTFASYFSRRGSMDGQEKVSAESSMNNLLYSIRGANSNVRQIILYDLKEGCYCMGNYTGYQNTRVWEKSWYEDTMAMDGHAFYPPSESDLLLSYSTGTRPDRLYTSICRVFFDNFHRPMGIVEVMQYQDIAFSQAIEPGSSYEIQVYIYDNLGNLAYPLDQDPGQTFDYLRAADTHTESVQNSFTGSREYVYYSRMAKCGFTTIVTIDRRQVLIPIFRYLSGMLLILLIGCVCCYFIAWKLSLRLSAPLTHMYDYLNDLDFQDKWKRLHMPDSHIVEIDKLRDSVNEFQERQIHSLQALMLLKEQELQAQMLALQSQTNPHFLYNALATINAMAEEGMTEGIRQMCLDMTEILRYISSNKRPLSTLEEELEHCDRYLNCLKIRFGSSLSYSIDVEDKMLELELPKLSIQLLVENAVKYTTKAAPPWHISIRGVQGESTWIIEVRDNGPGFSPEALENLQEKIREVNIHGLLPRLELDGLGMMNIYVRYYMLYKTAFIFDVGTMPSGGASVTIGGKVI